MVLQNIETILLPLIVQAHFYLYVHDKELYDIMIISILVIMKTAGITIINYYHYSLHSHFVANLSIIAFEMEYFHNKSSNMMFRGIPYQLTKDIIETSPFYIFLDIYAEH